MKNILFSFILFLSIGSLSWGQRYSFVQYSTPEGLPQSQVNAITQDKFGYLWVGTLGGLAKFNGKEFINHSTNNGLLSNRITALAFIDDRLYVGHDNGVSVQVENDRFIGYRAANSNVTSILQYNDKIYVTTNGTGVYQLAADTLYKLHDSPSKIRGATIHENELLLATQNGVYKMSAAEVFSQDLRFEDDSYSSIKKINTKVFATSYSGLCYQLQGTTASVFIDSDEFFFRNIYTSTPDTYWLNSREGVVKIEKNEIMTFTERSGLPISDISCIFYDREDNIWFGSAGKGLLKFSGEAFSHYNEKGGMPSDLITSVIQDENHSFWLSSYDKGIIHMIKDSAVLLNFPNVPVWNSVNYKGSLFFGSNLGLYEYSAGKWRVYLMEDGLPSNKVTSIYVTQRGDLFIGTSAGIVKWKNGNLVEISESASSIRNVRDFVEQGNSFFLATPQGLLKLTGESVDVTFTTAINCLEADGDKIWIGSEDGLYVYQNNNIDLFELPTRIGTNYINFLEKDHVHIYVGTNNGLGEINRKSLEYNHFGINAGLIDLETNLNSGYIDNTGSLWFGTASGLMHLDVEKRNTLLKNIPPLLNMKNVTVNFDNRPELFSRMLNGEEITLKHKENNIVIDFDGLYLSNSQAVRFEYKLEGLSENWSPPNNSGAISFTNLSPGTYELIVRASNPKGVYSLEKSIYFTILPPFYNAWWFYTLILIALILLYIVFDKLRVKTIEQKNYQNNLEISNKLSRLEQQSLNASMNRHFIFNALNSIQFFINSSDKQSANRYLSKFAKLIRNNLDSSHTANGMVPLSDELERLQLYLDLESMRFNNRFEYQINIDDHVEPESLKVPAMFLQPFVENSIIHGILPLEDRKGEIKINVTNHLDHIRIEIIDNGIGIENSLKNKQKTEGDHESQGVKITLGRIKLLQELSERSVELIGPHQINENDSLINGTRVIFKFLKQYLD